MKKFAELVLILSIVTPLVNGDYFRDYIEKWLMREKMECVFAEFDVAEDVLTHVPENLLEVQIGDMAVIPGDKFSALNLVSRPNVMWDCENPYIRHGAQSALVMVAADPGNQSLTWLVDSISGCDVSAGEEVCPYRSPAPTGAGARLYVICQFMRYPSYDKMTKFYAWMRTINPQNFSMVEFAKRGGYGDPYACNFIVLQNDNSSSPNDGQGYDSNYGCDVFR